MDIYNATLIGSIMTLAIVITISLAVNKIVYTKPIWPDLSLLVITKNFTFVSYYAHLINLTNLMLI